MAATEFGPAHHRARSPPERSPQDAEGWRDISAGLRAAFEASTTPVILLRGAELLVDYANPSFARLVERDVLAGRPLRQALPGLVDEAFLKRLAGLLRSGRPLEREPAPGPARPRCAFAYQPVVGKSGQVIGVLGVGADLVGVLKAEHALHEVESTLDLAMRASALGVWDWRHDTEHLIVSPRAREIWGFSPNEPVTKQMTAEVTHPDDYPIIEMRFLRALDPAIRDRTPYEFRVVLPDGGFRWVRAMGEAVFEEHAGVTMAVRYVGTMEDVTEERRMQDALLASESRLRLAIDAGRMAVWALNAEGEVEVTPEFNRILGLPLDAHPSIEDLRAYYDPGEYERVSALSEEAARRGERYIEFEQRHTRRDGGVSWFLVRAEHVVGPAGEPLGMLGVVMDVTERRESEERLKLLAREVDHRANNLLSVVQGLITLTKAETVSEFKKALIGRVSALARAHQLLASSRWVGADLRRLVEDEVRPYAAGDFRRVEVRGPDVALSAAVAQGIAMALHELATNAVKHGAWSTEEGMVSVSWEGGDGRPTLVLTWRERGGPRVGRPHRFGLGSKVLERAVSGSLGGHTELDWSPTGLVCRLTVDPLAKGVDDGMRST